MLFDFCLTLLKNVDFSEKHVKKNEKYFVYEKNILF